MRVSVWYLLNLSFHFECNEVAFYLRIFPKFYRENFGCPTGNDERRVWFGSVRSVAFSTAFMTLIPLCISYLNLARFISLNVFCNALILIGIRLAQPRRSVAEYETSNECEYLLILRKIGLWQREIFLAEHWNDYIWPMHYHMQFVNKCHSLKWMLRLPRIPSFT